MSDSTIVSFEFFPPKTDQGQENFKASRQALKQFNPAYYSVTFGAGGSTQDGTLEAIKEIQQEADTQAAPHISCITSSKASISALLEDYHAAGVQRLVCLRGDRPDNTAIRGELHYASELVAFIRAETGQQFHIEVAAYPEVHPESSSAANDLDNFRRKLDAGADGAITQYFYNIDAYTDFMDRCQQHNIDIPVVPGIMPITNYTQLARFSSACGAEIPRWLDKRLQDFGDDLDSIRAFGIDVVTRLCERLLEQGAPGLHFYTLNRSEASIAICKQLDLN